MRGSIIIKTCFDYVFCMGKHKNMARVMYLKKDLKPKRQDDAITLLLFDICASIYYLVWSTWVIFIDPINYNLVISNPCNAHVQIKIELINLLNNIKIYNKYYLIIYIHNKIGT